MSSPKERSEARRKALLSRRNDRLKKLTNSARGEDAPQFAHDDPPLVVPLKSFIGESTPERSQSPSLSLSDNWSPQQLQRAAESLRAAAAAADSPQPLIPSTEHLSKDFADFPWPSPNAPGLETRTSSSPALAYSQRLSAVLALLPPIVMLGYFVIFYEPAVYNSYAHIGAGGWSTRWSYLGIRDTHRVVRSEGVHPVVSVCSSLSFSI